MASSHGGMSAKNVEEALLEVLRRHPEGSTNEIFETEMASISVQARADALNKLLKKQQVQLFQMGSTILYKEVSAEDVQKFKGLSAEETMLYQVIKASGNTGLWTKDMRIRTNLAQPQITKILKNLEARRMVKSVKNVNNPSRKVFMLFELEPSREVTGGAWYTENQFDAEFIEVLRDLCFQYIQRIGEATLDDVASHIRSRGVSKVDLRSEDIASILQTLVYDGRLDSVDDGDDDDDKFRPALHSIPQTSALTSVPCGVCPVFSECRPGGLVSPSTCVYYEKWLQF